MKRVDVEPILCDKTAQVTKGSLPDTFVYQQIQKDRKQLLRVAVGPLEGPEPRARIRTAYYAKVSRYWDKDVISKVVKQHPAYGYVLVLFVFSILSVFCQGPDEQDHVCHTILSNSKKAIGSTRCNSQHCGPEAADTTQCMR